MREKLRKIASELMILAAVIGCSLAARSALADHYYIPSESMEYSLLVGDRVLVDKMVYGLRVPFTAVEVLSGRSPHRGEIVVFDSPESGVRLIKRVVAVAGDRVEVIDGTLFIAGRSLRSDTAADVEVFDGREAMLNLGYGGGPDLEPTVVPPGTVMVMGDNRGNSRDSRAFGFIAENEIYGRAFRLYYRSADGFVWKPM